MRLLKLSIILIIASLTISCNNYDDSLIIKNWKILFNQDHSLKTITQKSGWETVEIPSIILLPYPNADKFQFYWLKGEFNINDNPSRFYGISLGRVKLSDRVFINNRKIGSIPHTKVNWGPMPRNYIIPEGVLKKGVNNIYIQLGAYNKSFSGILDDVIIHPEKNYDHKKFISNLVHRQLPIGIMVFYAGLIISSLFAFFGDRNEKLYLFAFPLFIITIIYWFIYLSPYRLVSAKFFFVMIGSFVPLITMLFILTIQSLYKVYLIKYNAIIFSLMALNIILLILFRNSIYIFEIVGIVVTLTTLINIVSFFLLIKYLYSVNPDKFIFYMSTIMVINYLFITLIELYCMITGGLYETLFPIYLPLGIFILFSIIGAREIWRRKDDVKKIYSSLEEPEEKEVIITETSEEKLKRVIDFIKENYTCDISREGLAAAVGINPNYMGTLFKAYTGKKINDYINNLRIDSALEQLKSNNSRIIDIAFAVGFESLVTFNRIFKKVTGQTPSDYKCNA